MSHRHYLLHQRQGSRWSYHESNRSRFHQPSQYRCTHHKYHRHNTMRRMGTRRRCCRTDMRLQTCTAPYHRSTAGRSCNWLSRHRRNIHRDNMILHPSPDRLPSHCSSRRDSSCHQRNPEYCRSCWLANFYSHRSHCRSHHGRRNPDWSERSCSSDQFRQQRSHKHRHRCNMHRSHSHCLDPSGSRRMNSFQLNRHCCRPGSLHHRRCHSRHRQRRSQTDNRRQCRSSRR